MASGAIDLGSIPSGNASQNIKQSCDFPKIQENRFCFAGKIKGATTSGHRAFEK